MIVTSLLKALSSSRDSKIKYFSWNTHSDRDGLHAWTAGEIAVSQVSVEGGGGPLLPGFLDLEPQIRKALIFLP